MEVPAFKLELFQVFMFVLGVVTYAIIPFFYKSIMKAIETGDRHLEDRIERIEKQSAEHSATNDKFREQLQRIEILLNTIYTKVEASQNNKSRSRNG